MRIRRRPLPFPSLVTSPFPVSDPNSTQPISPPKTDASREETNRRNASFKIEQGLHPNRAFLPIDSSGLGTSSTKRDLQDLHSSPSTSFPPVIQKEEEEEEEEEEKESVESARNKGAQVNNTIKRRSTHTPNEEYNQDDEEKAKREKKVRRSSGSAVLMEGSRCSRVNGRGWRCSQPTLVGYSLCEHHLGKGRMKSLHNGVQGQLGCTEHKRKDHKDELGFGEKNGRRKRNRVPTMKARSLSSLLSGRNDYDDGEDYELIGDYYMTN